MKKLPHYSLAFFVIWAILNQVIKTFEAPPRLIIRPLWPVNVVEFRVPDLWHVLLAIVILWIISRYAGLYLSRITLAKTRWLLLIPIGLILTTNLLQGPVEGIVKPIRGDGIYDYWSDVDEDIRAEGMSVERLLVTFNTEQAAHRYRVHTITHPPGVLLFIHFLREIINHPLFVSTVILLIVWVATCVYYELLVNEGISSEVALLVCTLYLALPSTQVYGWSTIDAAIAGVMLLTAWSWLRSKPYAILISSLLLFVSTALTFSSAWLLLLLVYLEFRTKGGIRRTIICIGVVVALWFAVYLFWGFNYGQAMHVARITENPEPFLEDLAWSGYYITRLADVMEILVFYSPYLLVFTFMGWKMLFEERSKFKQQNQSTAVDSTSKLTQQRMLRKTMLSDNLLASSLVAVCLLIMVFISGSYNVGETARAAMFIYPFLLVPVAYYLHGERDTLRRYFPALLLLVFSQSVIFQLFGWFYW